MPHEARAVPASILLSSTAMAHPASLKICVMSCSCHSVALREQKKVMLHITSMAVLGIRRKMVALSLCSICAMSSSEMPAATEMMICCSRLSAGRICSTTSCMSHGFTASRTMSAEATAAQLSSVNCMLGVRSRSRSSDDCVRVVQMICASSSEGHFTSARAMAPPMLPAPMMAIRMVVNILFRNKLTENIACGCDSCRKIFESHKKIVFLHQRARSKDLLLRKKKTIK